METYGPRKIEIGTDEHTEVFAVDERGPGNANHVYEIKMTANEISKTELIRFQNGPIKENGKNGIHNEDLIAIVIDRLRGFQSGDFACRDNALALTKLQEALFWLRNRTNERKSRGIEGTSEL